MSYKALKAVNRCPAVKGPARRAAFQIADLHNDDTGIAWPGYELMAGREGVSTKTMETGVKQLERDGFVEVKRFRGRSNVYRLKIEKMEALEFIPEWKRARQQPASVPNTVSVAKNTDKTTETGFQEVQKPSSGDYTTKYVIKPTRDDVERPDAVHNEHTRLQWAEYLAHYRNRLLAGVSRPFWPPNAGYKPDTFYCSASHDLMSRYGFGDFIAAPGEKKGSRRS